MKNNRRFIKLIPPALRSVPYILQSHVFKAYCALENLNVELPSLPDSVWDYCVDIIENDEPKVNGLIAPELYALEEVVDATSGRDFGPDWLLNRGLMPLAYWAMHKKVESLGFPAVFESYLAKGLERPKFLGHEISVLAGHWQFYQDVIADGQNPEATALFLQRFTEFATATFSHGNDTVFEHPEITALPTDHEILEESLRNPGFFGHHVLAVVWAGRIKSLMTTEQRETVRYNLTVLNRWHVFGKPPVLLDAIDEDWSEETLVERLATFFLDGPTNIHQITFAEALVWVWRHHPGLRPLVAANVVCFTHNTAPQKGA